MQVRNRKESSILISIKQLEIADLQTKQFILYATLI